MKSRRIVELIILFTTLSLVILSAQVVYCHRIYMKLINVTESDNHVDIKVRVYFGGFGGASNVPIYIYSPDCQQYSICPPTNCKPYKVFKTDEHGFAVIKIPKLSGKWILAAIADPAHRVCKFIQIKETAKGKLGAEVSSKEVVPPLIDVLKVPEYVAAAIGVVVLIVIAFITKLFTKR